MTESEVLEKLEKFKEAIIKLKEEKAQVEKECRELQGELVSAKVFLEGDLADVKTENEELKARIKELEEALAAEKAKAETETNESEGWSTASPPALEQEEETVETEEKTSTRRKPVALVNDQPKAEMKTYRFGTSSPAAALKFKTFISKVVAGEELPFKITPEAAALQVGVSSKTKDSFINFLTSFKKDGKNLVVKVKDTYYSNFDTDTIVDYLFQEVEKQQ